MTALLITIDGPVGAGKTTVSRLLAEQLGYIYVDTGALYRSIGLAALEASIDPADETALAALCEKISIRYERTDDGIHLLLNDADVSERIRTPEISLIASQVSAVPAVRAFLLSVQQRLGAEKEAVFEGRDMGTVVFPDADIKFFLDADVAVRARRRYEEIRESSGQPFEMVLKDLEQRDLQDTTRKIAPLTPAPDAVHINATHKPADGVVAEMIVRIRERFSEILQCVPRSLAQ